jgi:putative peptide maturation system protein
MDDLAAVAAEALSLLVEIQRAELRPDEARRRFQPLEERHPALQLLLMAEHEEHSGAHHYEVVFGSEDAGGVFLTFCPNRGLPWMTRGAARLNDDLVRVDGLPIRLPDAMRLLDVAGDASLTERLLDALVLRRALEEHGLADAPVSAGELQRAMDDFRRRRGLCEASAMRRWLMEHGWSHQALEKQLETQVRAETLRARVTADGLRAVFEQQRAELERVTAGIAEVSTLAQARELAMQPGDFHARVERLLARGAARYRVERWCRFQCPAELRVVLFAGPAGSLSVTRVGDWFVVTRILARDAADLDDDTRRLLRDRLFREWLDERRRRARVGLWL